MNDNIFIIKPYFLITWSVLKYTWYGSRIIGPKHSFSSQGLKICHWNLNSLSSHMYEKVSLLSAFISVHKLDIICLSETYLNSETSPDDDNLEIPGYNIIRKDIKYNISSGPHCISNKNRKKMLPIHLSL